ncbi:UNVERIFIED_CONTAM: dipeptidase 1 (renal) [Siphonaria sp. JEL0065]|nr:dipeptidase 1 (renal) [Siphonaria sp. JEL0065]
MLLQLALFVLAFGYTAATLCNGMEGLSEVDLWAIPPAASGNETPQEAALRILKHAPVIDTHNDWPTGLKYTYNNTIKNINLMDTPRFHTDIRRLRKGMLGVQFWSAYVPCHDFRKETNSVLLTLENIDLIKRFVDKYPKHFHFAKTTAEIRESVKKGKIASLIGIEGAHQIDGSMGVLRMYFELGVRYMTLTHSCHTSWADSCNGAPLHNGITPDGLRFIREMNRLGMMVDLSHVSEEVMIQTIENSRAPVFFSHSSAFGVTGVPRNVPDSVLRLLVVHDGVVMINFIKSYVVRKDEPADEANVKNLADHIQYIKEMVGSQFIGIGADFDGSGINDFALKDVSTYPELFAELIERGFSEKEIVGIAGGNLLRVMEKVEKVAAQMQKDGEEMEEVGVTVPKFLAHALTAPAQPMFPPPTALVSSSLTESDDEPPLLSRSPSVASMNSPTPESSPSLRKQSLSLAPVVSQVVLVAAPALRPPVSKDQAAGFSRAVTGHLLARMKGHWHTDNPQKGSAYRALSIINGKADVSLLHAAGTVDIRNLGYYFPTNITFWIDPGCVSFRIGDSGSIANIWVDESVVSAHNHTSYGSIMTESSLASDSPQFTSARMALAAALPPSPPQLSRQQLRQLKIQQKQTELQEMARSLSQQYSVYNAHYPTLVNSPSNTSGTMNASSSPATTIYISSPPSLSSLGRQKSAPTTKQSSSTSKKYPSPKPHNDSLYNSSLSNNNAGFSQNSSYNNSNDSNNTSPQSRRTKSYNNSYNNKKSLHNHHNNNSNNNISENTNQQQQAPTHIPGLAFKDPHKMSRGGSSNRSSHKSKAYYGSSTAGGTAVC